MSSAVQLSLVERLAGGKEAAYLYRLEGDSRSIEVDVVRRRRKTLGIYVERNQRPELRVPLNCSWHDIRGFLMSRFQWMINAIDELSSIPAAPENSYVPGGEVAYLGMRYPLVLSKSRYNTICIEDEHFHVSCGNPANARRVEEQILDWYRRQGETLVPGIITRLLSGFPDEVHPNGLVFRKMKSRWGSCSTTGELCFNLLLMREPLSQIEFVVAHELCHLRHFAHNQAFYALMDRVMPDWREREMTLGEAYLQQEQPGASEQRG